MTGHFMVSGSPEELEYREYGSEGRELAKWKLGYQRFQTFSESVIQVLRTGEPPFMFAGDFREREYEGKTYTDAHVTAAWPQKQKTKSKPAAQPTSDHDLPF